MDARVTTRQTDCLMTDREALPALRQGGIDRDIGYDEPYATSHAALAERHRGQTSVPLCLCVS
jgi:hypothetical protein